MEINMDLTSLCCYNSLHCFGKAFHSILEWGYLYFLYSLVNIILKLYSVMTIRLLQLCIITVFEHNEIFTHSQSLIPERALLG